MTITKECYVHELPIGSVILDDIYTSSGVLLCPKQASVSANTMSLLANYKGKIKVMIETETEPESINDEIMLDDSFEFTESFKSYANQSIKTIYDHLDEADVVLEETDNLSGEICDVILNSSDIGINLSKIKVSDEYTFKHSVDVGTMAALIGAQLGESRSFIKEIALAGILHDLGKSKVPLEILNKKTKLTKQEFEIIMNHPVYSYQMIKDYDISNEIKFGVLNHHENIDGTGYPRGISGPDIGKMERILAIADVFDALVTERPYKAAKTPAVAIEIMYTMSNKFDIDYFRTFLTYLNAYPNGTTVLLSNGMDCTVIAQNKSFPLRPIVKDKKSGEVIDLSLRRDFLSVTIIN